MSTIWLALIVGCGETSHDAAEHAPEAAAAPAPAELTPAKKAAAVANAIAAGTAADTAMAAQGISADAFRELLYDIAEDPAMTDEYLSARN